jgi:hypothetical protein
MPQDLRYGIIMSKEIRKDEIANKESVDLQKSYDRELAEQKRKDSLRELEDMRKWVEEDVSPPLKMSCKISKHIVANKNNEDS